MSISVYNWTGDTLSLNVSCNDSSKTTNGASLNSITSITDESAEPSSCGINWIPGSYNKDIDGFVEDISFQTVFKKNGQTLSFANVSGTPELKFDIDKNGSVKIAVIKSFLPPSMTYAQWNALHAALPGASTGDQDLAAYAFSQLYRHYADETEASLDCFDVTTGKAQFDKVEQAVMNLITENALPASVSQIILPSAVYYYESKAYTFN